MKIFDICIGDNPYTYITQARLKSKNITRLVNTQRARIKTGCLGYYKHYEKTLPLDRLQHILYRHSPHVFDDEFKAIFQNRLNELEQVWQEAIGGKASGSTPQPDTSNAYVTLNTVFNGFKVFFNGFNVFFR